MAVRSRMQSALRKSSFSGPLRWAARKLRHRLTKVGVILMYHRVTQIERDPYGICVTPERFEAQMQVLRERAQPMPLEDLVQAATERRIPRRAVAVTFDDGYLDNLASAYPVLERCGVHATVFVATGLIGAQREFWWDELERIILRPGPLPNELILPLGGAEWHTSVDGDGIWSCVHESDREWTLRCAPSRGRHRLFATLYQRISSISDQDRMAAMVALRQWSATPDAARDTHAVLSRADLHALADRGLVRIGAHSVTHSRLDTLNPIKQKGEIEQSRRTLTEITGRPVNCFSYPHGACSPTTLSLVREAGFSFACGSGGDVVRADSDRFDLPRLVPGNWSRERFSDWLDGCLGC